MNLGLNFSKRGDGNCGSILNLIKQKEKLGLSDLLIINTNDLNITSCCDHEYACFATGECPNDDGMSVLIRDIKSSKEIFISMPVYSGHLCSSYYKFYERLSAYYRINDILFNRDYWSKVTFIIVVNKEHGLDRAVNTIKEDFDLMGVKPSIITYSSSDFAESSISGKFKNNRAAKAYIVEAVKNRKSHDQD